MEAKTELILEIGAEGGSIKLLGTKASNKWRFRTSSLDQTADLLSDEDRDGLPPATRHETVWVDSWDAALGLLDKYPWHRLHPIFVHPEFQELVLMAVLDRCEFPFSTDGPSPRLCPKCERGRISVKLGRFGCFVRCSNYPECKFTRNLSRIDRDEESAWSRVCGLAPRRT